MTALLDDNLDSARAIVRMPMNQFTATYSETLGGAVQAARVYQRAHRSAATALALYGKFGAGINATAVAAVPSAPPSESAARSAASVATLPDWGTLFGAQVASFCECEHCGSVYGPAAYLVDILNVLKKRAAADVLFGRRPDLAQIELTCKNTNTTLPYVDLVNELLESAVSPGTSVPERSRQTTKTAAELLAYPEYLNAGAYEVLKAATYPWDLPFHLWWEEVRGYFEHLGIQREVLMQMFQAEPSAIELATERLGLTAPEREVIVTSLTDPAQVAAHWGVAELDAEDFSNVSTLLRRSRLTFAQLEEILATAFIRSELGGDRYVIAHDPAHPEHAGTCDTAELYVQPAPSAGTLDRFHRFVRLWRKTGCTVPELDRIITAIAGTALDESLLITLAHITRLATDLGLPLANLVDLWTSAQPDEGALARALGISVDDLHALIALTGAAPFSAPADMAQFTARVAQVKRSPFSIAQLKYIYLHSAAAGDPIAPLEDDSIRLLKDLQDALAVTADDGSRESLIVQTLGSALALDPAVATLLLLSLLKSKRNPALPAVNDYLALLGNGVSARYYDDTGLTEPHAVERIESTIQFDWGSGSPDPAINGDFGARFTGKLFAAERDGYTFAIRTSGGVRLWVAGRPDPIVDEWNNAGAADFRNVQPLQLLQPRQFYDLVLEFRKTSPDAYLHLSWSNSSTPEEIVPARRFFTTGGLASLGPVLDALTLLRKAALLTNTLKITSRELTYLAANANDFAGLDLNALPTDPPALFSQWERLRDVVALRDSLPRGDRDIFDLFTAAASSPNLDEVKALAAAVTGWNRADVDALVALFGLDAADLTNELALLKLRECIGLSRRLGIPVSQLSDWATSPPDQAQAGSIRSAISAKFGAREWLERARPLRDRLRERQRAALVAYQVARPDAQSGHGWDAANGLYNHFLVDVEMSPCQLTSRVKLAIGSAQLFVQRSLMNLEPAVTLRPEDARLWQEWMRSYRVWEANRKVFLYPENWIVPELRDDKSPFFKDLEDELQQNEITNSSAETALRHYLEKLDGVARLQICGMYRQREADGSGADILHVVARTFGAPSLYYYRKRIDAAYWTPWERVDVDIEGDHLVPVIFNRRLYLFWPVFTEKAPQDVPIPPPNTAGAKPATFFEIKLAWSEYRDGKWSAKRVSTEALTTPGLSRFREDYVFNGHIDNSGSLVFGCYTRRA